MDDDFFSELKTETKVDVSQIEDLNLLYNSELGTSFIILDNSKGDFLVAKLTKKELIPGNNDTVKKVKTPNIAQFTFTTDTLNKQEEGTPDNTFILNKFYRGSIENWGDDGGEIFSTYIIFNIVDDKKDNIEYLTKTLSILTKNKTTFNKEMKIINLPIPKTKYKNKYTIYPINY